MLRRATIQRELDHLLDRLRRVSPVALHLGAGGNNIPGMINVDLIDASADRGMDCRALEGFSDNSVDLIETHHMIEHLSFAEADQALREWNRALKPGGYLVMTCPDMTAVAWYWLKLRAKHWYKSQSPNRAYALKMIYGSQEHGGMFHKSGYDRADLQERLPRFGFSVEFAYTPYPHRATPSLLVIARKKK